MKFDFWDSDKNRYFVCTSKNEVYWCDEYRITDDEKAELVCADVALTYREILSLDNGKEFLRS